MLGVINGIGSCTLRIQSGVPLIWASGSAEAARTLALAAIQGVRAFTVDRAALIGSGPTARPRPLPMPPPYEPDAWPFFLSNISLAYARALSNRAASGWPWLLSLLAIARISRSGMIDMMNLIHPASCP